MTDESSQRSASLTDVVAVRGGDIPSDASLVNAWILAQDLAYKKIIHSENRAGTGVDPIKAHKLGLKISLQGYSESVGDSACARGMTTAASVQPAASAQAAASAPQLL